MFEFICCSSQALSLIGKEEGVRGYWKGNLPQVTYCDTHILGRSSSRFNFTRVLIFFGDCENVFQVIRIIPYSAVQLFSYEVYKVLTGYMWNF